MPFLHVVHTLVGKRYGRLLIPFLLAFSFFFCPFTLLSVHAAPSQFDSHLSLTSQPSSSIVSWFQPENRVDFQGNAVFLLTHDKKRQVAIDDPKRLDPLFTHLGMVSPDGKLLLYVTAQDRRWKNASLELVDLATLHKSVLVTFPTSFWPQVRWSPNSRQIAYVLVNDHTDHPEIFVRDITGTSSQKVVSASTFTKKSLEGYEQSMFGWLADSQSIMYYDDALTPHVSYTISLIAKTSSTHTLTSAQRQSIAPNTAKDTICNAPLFNQTSYSDIMQSGGDSIASSGCALTSSTMMVDYYAGSQIYDPSSMNKCLGTSADPLYWGVVASSCSQRKVTFDSSSDFSWKTLDAELLAGHPTIVGVSWFSGGTHYFLVVSGDGSDNAANYQVNDPGYGARHALSDITASARLMWIKAYHPIAGSWSPCSTGTPTPIPTPTKQSGSSASPTLVTYTDGSKDLIAVGSDGRMWHNWTNGSATGWTGWNWWSTSTPFANASPTLITYTDGSKDLIAVGSDGRMWHNWTNGSATGWTGWNWWSTNTPFANAAPTLVTYADGSKDLIAVGSDGRMWHNWTNGSATGWTGWNWWSTSTPFTNATPTLITYGDGSKDLIAVGSDGRMWHNWTNGSATGWTGWNWWSAVTIFANSSTTLVTYGDGSKDLIAVGSDGRMWHNWTNGSATGWIDWNWWSTSTPFTNAAPTLVTYGDGSKDLIAVGSDGRMWHNWTNGSATGWTGWNWWSTSTPFANASPTLITYTDGSKDLIAVGSDGRMWHNWTNGSATGWTGWNWWSTNTAYV